MTPEERLEKQYHLRRDSLWCINWSLVFAVVSILADLIAIWEINQDDLLPGMEIMAVALVTWFIAGMLYGKSRKLHRQARDIK